jgi:hypothetical protein
MTSFKHVSRYFFETNAAFACIYIPGLLLPIATTVIPRIWPIARSVEPLIFYFSVAAVGIGLGVAITFALSWRHCIDVDRFRSRAAPFISSKGYSSAIRAWLGDVDVLLDGQRWRGEGAEIVESTFRLIDRSARLFYVADVLCRTPEGAWFRVDGQLRESCTWRPLDPSVAIVPIALAEAKNRLAALGRHEYSKYFGEPPLARP